MGVHDHFEWQSLGLEYLEDTSTHAHNLEILVYKALSSNCNASTTEAPPLSGSSCPIYSNTSFTDERFLAYHLSHFPTFSAIERISISMHLTSSLKILITNPGLLNPNNAIQHP